MSNDVKQYIVSKGVLLDFESLQPASVARLVNADDYELVVAENNKMREELEGIRSRAVPEVWYGKMPESNGKSNWTAILHRGDLAEGVTLCRSEYPDRVRYHADCARFVIGELADKPFVCDYDADAHSGYKPSPDLIPT